MQAIKNIDPYYFFDLICLIVFSIAETLQSPDSFLDFLKNLKTTSRNWYRVNFEVKIKRPPPPLGPLLPLPFQ